MRMCEVRTREVINLCNCKKLGYVVDIEVDLCTGRILALIVPKVEGVLGLFAKDTVYVIPYECVKKVGDEIIFVEITEEKCISCCTRR